MNFVSVTETNKIIFKHGKLLKDINPMDIIKYHFGSRNNLKIYNLGLITGTKFIRTVFRCSLIKLIAVVLRHT